MNLEFKFRRNIYLYIFCVLVAGYFISCESDDPDSDMPQSQLCSSENPCKILTISDSRGVCHPSLFETYRYPFWKELIAANYSFDLIGPESDSCGYEPFEGYSFDPDHGAIGGAHTTDILTRLENDFYPQDSDILLLGIGGNDLLGGDSIAFTIENISSIIDYFMGYNNDTIILIEQLAPASDFIMTEELTQILINFNSEISQLILDYRMQGQEVYGVNMYEQWQSNEYLADDYHYNEAGAQEVALRYFNALVSNLE